MLLAILSTILVTVFLTVVFLNLRAGEKQIRHKLAHEFSVEHPQFLRSMGNLLGAGILPGNRVQALHNGVQIFPAMLEAIRGARETVTFETYIYWSGEIGREFSEALSERARAGVKVQVMLDWAGSAKMEVKYLEALRTRKSTGAIRTSGSKAPRSRKCRPLSPTTGSRPAEKFSAAARISRSCDRWAARWRRCSRAHGVKAARAYA